MSAQLHGGWLVQYNVSHAITVLPATVTMAVSAGSTCCKMHDMFVQTFGHPSASARASPGQPCTALNVLFRSVMLCIPKLPSRNPGIMSYLMCAAACRVSRGMCYPPVRDVIATNNQPTLKRLHILRSTHLHTHLV